MENFKLIPLSQLHAHPHNPRGLVDAATVEELADSIREKGILQPLLVAPNGNGFKIVAGHRRHCAAEIAGLAEVPCVVRPDLTEAQQEELMLIENLQREDISPLQEARAFGRLVDQGYTRADIARNTGLNSTRVQASLQILKLSEPVQELFADFQMATSAVPFLVKVSNPDRQAKLANLIMNRTLSVSKLQRIVADMEQKGDDSLAPAKPKQTRQRPVMPQPTHFGRADGVRALTQLGNRTLTYADVLASLEGVCGGCGMSGLPTICSACPLPQMLKNLTGETVNENAQS